jgi:hypothetical protein
VCFFAHGPSATAKTAGAYSDEYRQAPFWHGILSSVSQGLSGALSRMSGFSVSFATGRHLLLTRVWISVGTSSPRASGPIWINLLIVAIYRPIQTPLSVCSGVVAVVCCIIVLLPSLILVLPLTPAGKMSRGAKKPNRVCCHWSGNVLGLTAVHSLSSVVNGFDDDSFLG